MDSLNHRLCRSTMLSALAVLAMSVLVLVAAEPPANATTEYATTRTLVQMYCLNCHSTKVRKGSLDLERFATLDDVRRGLKVWQGVIEQIEAGEMPPKSKPQPTDAEKERLLAWARGFLAAEARARAGDPGRVPLRRLSNAEYDCTVRDLTGVDLRPTREFPADGAAGEGFTNAAEALTDVSPALLTKYLNAARDVAAHAVLLPDGFRFSPAKTRRDWTNEETARLREFYAPYAPEGRLPLAPYLAATLRYRDALLAGRMTPADVAAKEKLNSKYLAVLWQTLTDRTPSIPLDAIRTRWRNASEEDVARLTAEVTAWQASLWKVVRIGSYMQPAGKDYIESTTRQVANDPVAVESRRLGLDVKPVPGQTEVVLYLVAHERKAGGRLVWHRPRFSGPGKPPLLLRDYAQFGPAYEVDYAAVFADSAKYLAAAVEAANDPKTPVDDLAKKHDLDAAFLKRWIEVLAVEPLQKEANSERSGKVIPAVALEPLDEKAPKNDNRPAINGWRRKGTELPSLVANSSDTVEYIPGKASPHGVMVHPTPKEFVAVVWKSPVEGTVRIAARVAHAHPACGNGVAWWIEHRRAERAMVLAEGAINLGGTSEPPAKTQKVAKGDLLILAVDARDANHVCDLTEIGFIVSEVQKPGRVWDLSADVADSVLDGNPHADKHANRDTWSFVRGPSRAGGKTEPVIPPESVLGRWRVAAPNAARKAELAKLAEQVQTLLCGPRPNKAKSPDRILYDNLVSLDSVLVQGIDAVRLAKPRPRAAPFGLGREQFGRHPTGKPTDEASLVVAANSVTAVRLPAALFREREFVVEGRLDGAPGDRVAQFRVLAAPPGPDDRWDAKSPVVASPGSAGYKQLLREYDAFRRCFPLFVCFPQVIPTDEVVSLKMFHREDEPLIQLFLDDEQTRRLERLWAEHRFVSRQPVAEAAYLPQFIGFVTQDQPKEMVAYFESQRPNFKKRADEFERDVEAAIPKQVDALLEFTAKAYRRPLRDKEKDELVKLYTTLRKKDLAHEEAFRAVLDRVLVSAAFLFRIEQAPPGKQPGPVNDWELATRLSYFLWSSVPDPELRRVAAAGQLRDPRVLAAQTRRMLKDDRVRALAIEFGTQWIHVRGFDELKEKNEKLFPTFDAELRGAIYEESIRFFQDLFQADRTVTQILDADHTFLNERLAKHYGIPGVTGPQWRRVEGVRKYGRGGVLGLASVQARQAGASRTSPVLRGNWVVETLLGEKLPRPPADVPQLPEEEGGEGLTMRQLVEKHTRIESCAACHQRIDPFGFALEKYDPIGRLREKDLGGLAVDARSRLKDGTEFEGMDGLRTYLLTKKKDVVVRLFCRRLLGYALGRAVTLSDQPLIDEMVAELNRKGRMSAAVLTIVRSPQFRMVRGADYSSED